LHSEVERALFRCPGLRRWYELGAAVAQYALAAGEAGYPDPPPDCHPVLRKAGEALEEAGFKVPVLEALAQGASVERWQQFRAAHPAWPPFPRWR
jgi:hypothetical protein